MRDACGIGFVAHIKGERSRAIVDQGLEILRRLSHRAACGADPDTGDGAGITLQLPEAFLRAEAERLDLDLPPNRRFAVGNIFLPPDPAMRAACEAILEGAIYDEGQRVIGWRDSAIHHGIVARAAPAAMTGLPQGYVRRPRGPPSAWARTLFV